MTNLTRVAGALQCSNTPGDACVNRGAGHAMQPIQLRVVGATPSKWADGIVKTATSDGWIGVDPLDGGDTVWLWNHEDLTSQLPVGQPVAVHLLYNALAIGGARISVFQL
jgi:hypothetical protein